MRQIVGIAAVMLLAGCPMGLGERCAASDECQEGLLCRSVAADGPGVCDYPLHGEGDTCAVAAECEEALTCSNHFSQNQRYGLCVPRRGVGEACFVDRDCVSGACEGASASSLGVCQ